MAKKDIYRSLPPVIKTALLLSEGWLVGSAISNIIHNREATDYDIVVPSRELFQLALSSLIACGGSLRVNSFGGMKYEDDTLSLDIWPEELGHFLQNANAVDYAFNLKRQVLLTVA